MLGKYILSESKHCMETASFHCIKYPVFSNFALNGLDPKVGPEMKSTGEGICLAQNFEEALRKVFHPVLKDRTKKNRIICGNGEKLSELRPYAERLGIELKKASDLKKDELQSDVLAYYSTNESNEDQKLREIGTKNRIPTFSEKETLMAFFSAMNATNLQVTPIEEWHENRVKDVTVV